MLVSTIPQNRFQRLVPLASLQCEYSGSSSGSRILGRSSSLAGSTGVFDEIIGLNIVRIVERLR